MSEERINVDKVAALAMIDLSDEERAAFEKDLPAILEYVTKLAEVDTSNVQAREYLTGLKNQFRDDVVQTTEGEREAVIDAFPKKTGDALEVPAVFE